MKSKTIHLKPLIVLVFVILLFSAASVIPAFAISESDVQAQVDASGKEAVAGNVLIWFLCAVAFLKVSQKIDSFMASIGVNVGHTGGSMLSDVLIVSRALSGAVKAAGHAFSGGSGGGSSSGVRSGSGSGAASTSSFFRGGLAGMVSRTVNNSAVKTATENKASTNSVQSDMAREAVYSATHSDSSNTIHSAGAGNPAVNGSGGSVGNVSAAANHIVQNGSGDPISSTPGEVQSPDGESAPIMGGVPVGDVNPITLSEAEDEGEIHPIPSGDPGVTIHAAPAASADNSNGGAGAESALQAPVVQAANGGSAIPSGNGAGSGGEAVSMPQTIPQSDPGVILSAESPSIGSTTESHSPATDMPVPPAPAEGGIGVSINSSSETDAATVNSSSSENVSMPVTSNSANTVKAPGTNSVSGSSTPAGGGGSVLHTHSQQSAVSSSSKESNSQTTRTQATHSATSQSTVQMERVHGYGIGGAMFMKSLASGGSFANNTIGKVATGSAQTTGTISGDMASQALTSYMGHTAIGSPPATTPTYTDVEIGGGRISGIETAPGGGQSMQFTMYHTDQYAEPRGDYTKVVSADGATWYKQYAQDAVERKPYQAPDNTVAYQETIVKRMPDPPRRKDKM